MIGKNHGHFNWRMPQHWSMNTSTCIIQWQCSVSWEQKTTGMKESSPQLLFQHSLPQSNRQLLQEIGKRSIVIHGVNSIRSVKFSVARRNAMIWRATSGVEGYHRAVHWIPNLLSSLFCFRSFAMRTFTFHKMHISEKCSSLRVLA